jgi:hypothetical protein
LFYVERIKAKVRFIECLIKKKNQISVCGTTLEVCELRRLTLIKKNFNQISVCGTTLEVGGHFDGTDVCGRTTGFDYSSKHEASEGRCRHSQRSVQAGTKNLQKSYR